MEVGKRAQEVVERKFIESQGLHQHVACGIGHTDEVEIALKDAVLTRCAVDGDVGKIKVVATIFGFKRKII